MKWSDWKEKVKTSFIAVKKSSCNGSDIKIKSLRCDRQQILISNFTVILAHSELSQFIFHGFQFNFDGLINFRISFHCTLFVCASSSESERTCNKFYSHHTQASIFYYTISCSQAWYIKHNSDRLDVLLCMKLWPTSDGINIYFIQTIYMHISSIVVNTLRYINTLPPRSIIDKRISFHNKHRYEASRQHYMYVCLCIKQVTASKQ